MAQAEHRDQVPGFPQHQPPLQLPDPSWVSYNSVLTRTPGVTEAPQVQGSVPQACPWPGAGCKSRGPWVLLTKPLKIWGLPCPFLMFNNLLE